MMAPRGRPRWLERPSRSRRDIAREIDDEVEEWIALRAREWESRGLDAAAARARATTEFGDVAETKAYCLAEDLTTEQRSRMERIVEELRQDVRGAIRGMTRTPLLTGVLLLTLATGIGATSAVYAVCHAILLRALPWRDDASLIQVHTTERGERQPMGQLSVRALDRLQQGRMFEGVAAIASGGGVLTGAGEPERVPGARVTQNLGAVLGVAPSLGGWFPAGADAAGTEPTVVLTDALWRRRFGADSTIVGRALDVSGVTRRVIGVMPPGFMVPLAGYAELLTPLDVSAVSRDEERSHKFRFIQAVARVRSGVSTDAVREELSRVFTGLASERPDAYTGMSAEPVPLREELTGAVRVPLLALTAAAGLLLLIACANVASVLLARAVTRQGEFAVRAALGAGRARVVRQVVTESLVLSAIGGVAGLVVAYLGTMALRAMAGTALPEGFEVTMGVPAVLVTAGASLACGLVFGIAPAFLAGRLATRGVAGGGLRGTETHSRMRLRRGLVVAQVSLSLGLLLGAGLLSRSLRRVMDVDLGYRTTQLATFRLSLPGTRYDTDAKHDVFWANLSERLSAVAGIERVGITSNLPLTGSAGASLVIEGRPHAGDRPPEVRYGSVSDEYFQTMGIPLVRGRTFQSGDERADVRAVIVSEATAKRFWGESDPIGSHVRLGPDPTEPWSTVVGIAGDVVLGTSGEIQPAVFSSMRYDRWGVGDVVIAYRTSAPPVAEMRRVVSELDPALPTGAIARVDEMRGRELAGRRLPLQLIGSFAVFAVLLVALGLYGVGASQVSARRRELGVRLALGATPGTLRRMVLADGLRTVVMGVGVGIPLALSMARGLNALLYEVKPWDPVVVAAVVGLLVVVGYLAALVPARRATGVQPAEVLRG